MRSTRAAFVRGIPRAPYIILLRPNPFLQLKSLETVVQEAKGTREAERLSIGDFCLAKTLELRGEPIAQCLPLAEGVERYGAS